MTKSYKKYRKFFTQRKDISVYRRKDISKLITLSLFDRIYFGYKFGDRGYLINLFKFVRALILEPMKIETKIFSSQFYKSHNIDLKSTDIMPWRHYHVYGILEMRRPNDLLDLNSIELYFEQVPSPLAVHMYINKNKNRRKQEIPHA